MTQRARPAGRRFHVEKFYRTNQFAPKEYPFSFLVYALSSFTYSLVAITMLTIYRVPEEPFRRLFPVDICACLGVIQGVVSFQGDVVDTFIRPNIRGLGRRIDGFLAPLTTALSLYGAYCWWPYLNDDTRWYGYTLLIGPITFLAHVGTFGVYPDFFFTHTIWHISMPLSLFFIFRSICNEHECGNP